MFCFVSNRQICAVAAERGRFYYIYFIAIRKSWLAMSQWNRGYWFPGIFTHRRSSNSAQARVCMRAFFFVCLNFNELFSSSIVVYSPFSGYISFKRDTVEKHKNYNRVNLVVDTRFIKFYTCVCVLFTYEKKSYIHMIISFSKSDWMWQWKRK